MFSRIKEGFHRFRAIDSTDNGRAGRGDHSRPCSRRIDRRDGPQPFRRPGPTARAGATRGERYRFAGERLRRRSRYGPSPGRPRGLLPCVPSALVGAQGRDAGVGRVLELSNQPLGPSRSAGHRIRFIYYDNIGPVAAPTKMGATPRTPPVGQATFSLRWLGQRPSTSVISSFGNHARSFSRKNWTHAASSRDRKRKPASPVAGSAAASSQSQS